MAQYRESVTSQGKLAWQSRPAQGSYSNSKEKCDIARNKICDIMGFVSIFRKNEMEIALGQKVAR